MNKLASKVAQGGLWALAGYEMGSKLSEENIVIQIDEEDLHKNDKEKSDQSDTLILLVGFLIIVLVIALLVAIMKIIMSKNSRSEVIEMNNRAQLPIV